MYIGICSHNCSNFSFWYLRLIDIWWREWISSEVPLLSWQLVSVKVEDDVETKYGVDAHMSVYNLTVVKDQFSAHRLCIENGPSDLVSAIYVGWAVSQALNCTCVHFVHDQLMGFSKHNFRLAYFHVLNSLALPNLLSWRKLSWKYKNIRINQNNDVMF